MAIAKYAELLERPPQVSPAWRAALYIRLSREDGDKADIADVVIRAINESQPLTTIADVKAEMPETKELIDKLNLEISNDREPKE